MAYQTLDELLAHRRESLVRSDLAKPPVRSSDLRGSVQLKVVGATIAISGLALLACGLLAAGSALILGGAILYATTRWRVSRGGVPQVQFEGRPEVRIERARRILAVLEARGGATFEALLAHLRWTESALLETLCEMKDRGVVDEDVDLETGQWVYRSQEPLGGSMRLEPCK